MLIKSADDKSKRLRLLQELDQSPQLNTEQKAWLKDELWRLRTGMQGEKDAAFYIDADYARNDNYYVLHDLRIEVDGEVAQIDHLLMSRTLIYLLETKNFNGNVQINEHGEFTITYANGKRIGIPSPLEQSRRHEQVLLKLFDRLGIRARTGGPLECHHVVLFHPKVVIERPDPRQFDTSNIIKADGLRTWHDRFVDKEVGVLKTLTLSLNVRSQATVKEWAEKLARQHRPPDLLALPDFMAPQRFSPAQPAPAAPTAPAPAAPAHVVRARPVCATCGQALSEPEARYCRSHAQRFGGGLYCRQHQAAFPAQARAAAAPLAPQRAATPAAEPRQAPFADDLRCATCGAAITPQERDYCRRDPRRFGGLQYCRQHQAAFPASRGKGRA